MIARRELLGAVLLVAVVPGAAAAGDEAAGAKAMHGLIGKMSAKPGERDALARVLLDGVAGMPGCLSYIVAEDPSDADALWITEVWDSEASHGGSLELPSVKAAIAKGRPLIAGMSDHRVTRPLGGHGLAKR